MKLFLFIILSTSLLLQPISFGQVFDTPGLVNRLTIKTDGHIFEVHTVSNFDIPDYQFSSDEKRLSVIVSSNVSNNLSELQIPKNLLDGNFTVYLNNQEILADIQSNEKITFIAVEFPGKGLHKLDIIGTKYLPNAAVSNIQNPQHSKSFELDSVLLFIIIGIIVAIGAGVAIFLKKQKRITH
ncbi:MAG TPA: hypothetical protein VFG25_03140 [Nitrosopumilaceae archaeon]|nr:hypothetical protein [Nitrosopumilaceae archaeon]